MEQILKDFFIKDEAMDVYIDSKTIYLSKEDVDILLKRQKKQLKLCGIGSNEVALLDKFTANDLDKAFIAGCINVGGIDGLDKELKRLKKLGFKTPTEALLAIKNSKQ